jgi:hypothetical protein
MESTQELGNPYLTIWTQPRLTIRQIVNQDPRYRVILLVVVAGELGALANLMAAPPMAFTIGAHPISQFSPHVWRMIRLGGLIIWPLLAIVFLYIQGALIRWTGGLLGGTGKSVEVRAALAWSRIPGIVNTALYGLALATGLLSIPIPAQSFDLRRAIAGMFSAHQIVFTILLFWELAITFKCIGEVHHFSAWKGTAAWLLSVAAVIGAFMGTALLLHAIALLLRHSK